ncbi:MAG: VacJ family lipoprotein [Gammaproteobacteria bacterium]|nr:VacJ family lipoprotein [Gammaproteobacteria bacterium]
MRKQLSKIVIGSLALTAMALSGCAKKPDATVNNDPLEGYNRFMFAFNHDIDRVAIRPVAQGYKFITPVVLQKGVTNFFNNTFEITSFPNDFLQGNFKYMAVDFWRFVINTTLGVGGLFDIATRIGIQPHMETFGLTLAKWRQGAPSPYFVVPVFGPATIEGSIGLAGNALMTPWPYFASDYITYIPPAVGLISLRAEYLDADKLIANAFDPYIFVRDAFMQRNKQRIESNNAHATGY